MTFVHPAMLACSAAAAAPWVVHLLNRGRTRTVAWGAMMFLTGDASAGDSRSRLRSWSLLLLRSLLIILVAVALARPIVKPGPVHWPTAGLRVGGPAAAVILIDTSPAMAYSVNGRTRFDQAREVALQLLPSFDPATRVGLATTGSTGSTDSILPTADVSSVSTRLQELKPAPGGDDLAAALDRAARMFDTAGGSEDHRVFVIGDRHAAAWRNATESFTTRWRGGPRPAVVVIPVGGEEADNLAVESIRFLDPPVVRDVPAVVEVVVRNLGPDARTGVPLTVYTQAKNLAETVVQIPARSQKTVRLTVRFPEPGSRVVSAAVKSTGLTDDDRADTAVDVVDAVRVFHVTAPGAPGGPVALALAPFTAAGRRGPGDAAVANGSDRQWPAGGLAETDVVVVDGDVRVSADHAGEIEQFVLDGGGLLLLAGRQNPPFDPGLWKMIAAGTPPAVDPGPAKLASIDRRDPVWQFLVAGPVPDVSFSPHLALTGLPADAKIPARFDANTPAMARIDLGRGHVLMVAGPASRPDDDFARSPVFLPWLQSAVHSLAGGLVADRNLSPGRSIVARTPAEAEDRNATVQLMVPGSRREPATVTRFDDGSEVRFTHTAVPGTYRLRYRAAGREVVENYVVSAQGSPVDLTPMTDAGWKSLEKLDGFERVDPTPAAVAAAAARSGASREIWIDLLGLVAVLAVAESVWSGR
jgi:hypothetical protein